MWFHFRSFPESQIHFARADESRSFRIHSRGLQIKSQIGCSFCLCCVFICQEQLSSLSAAGACYCQSPRPVPALLPPQQANVSTNGPKIPLVIQMEREVRLGPQKGDSPSWVFRGTCLFWPRLLARALPCGAYARILEVLSGERVGNSL